MASGSAALEAVEKELGDLLADEGLRDLLREQLDPDLRQPVNRPLRSLDIVDDVLEDIRDKNPDPRKRAAAGRYLSKLRELQEKRRGLTPLKPTNQMRKPTGQMTPKSSHQPGGKKGQPSFKTMSPPTKTSPPASTSTKAAQPKPARAAPGLKSAAGWLEKVSPFQAAMLYLELHAGHFAALADVKERVKLVKDLQKYINELELAARTLRKAINELWNAEADLPPYPLQSYEGKPGQTLFVSAAELDYVEQYARAAGGIYFDALVANSMLNSAIQGRNTVVAQARAAKNFTRQAAWQVVIDLE